MKFRILYCIVVFNICFILILKSQNWEIPITHYTMKDGLPSNEIYDVIEDGLGYVYLTTDNGFCRYDGYEFKTYGIEKGLNDRVVFDMQIDTFGRIWMNSISGKLFYYSPELDSIIDDPLINYNKGQYKGIKPLYFIDKSKDILNILLYFGGLRRYAFRYDLNTKKVIKDGTKTANLLSRKGTYISLSSEIISLSSEIDIKYYNNIELLDKNFNVTHHYSNIENYNIAEIDNYFHFENYHFISNKKNSWMLSKNKILKIGQPKIQDIDVWADGSIIVSYGNEKGLRGYKDLQDFISDKPKFLLNKTSISNTIQSGNGLYWSSSSISGLYKFQNPDLLQSFKFKNDQIIKSVFYSNKIFLFLKSGMISTMDCKSGNFGEVLKTKFSFNNAGIIYNKLYFFAENGVNGFLKNNKIENIRVTKSNGTFNKTEFLGYSLHEDLAGKNILGLYSSGVIKYNLQSREVKSLKNSRVYCLLKLNNSKILTSTTTGLFTFRNDGFENEFQYLDPYFKRRIDYIIQLPDSTVVLASKNEGVYIWNNNMVCHEDIYQLHGLKYIKGIFKRGNEVWVNSSIGIIILQIEKGQVISKKIFNSYDGLPNKDVIDIIFHENLVLLIYNDEIVKADYSAIMHNSESKNIPFISTLLSNGKKIPIKKVVVLDYLNNNLSLEILAIDHFQNGNINYQYSINESEYINLGKFRNINLFQLSEGVYNIGLRAQNREGNWGPINNYKFIILPPWWKTWWFYGSCLIGVSFLTYFIMKRRLIQQKKESAMKAEIRNLEKAALQAQMNPHFIFNSLNSIQKFILTNDKEVASEYLSKFASLIRLNLKASNSELVLLQEEISLLSLYLELEKLRFKNKFEYKFETRLEESLMQTVLIPPMLIQPIIENAILHGIAGLEGKGSIVITLENHEERQSLKVVVSDNGKGISNNKTNDNHQSFGSKITKKRLELISQHEKDNFTLSNILNINNEIIGTKAELYIKYKVKDQHE